jgi:hypothetical protein
MAGVKVLILTISNISTGYWHILHYSASSITGQEASASDGANTNQVSGAKEMSCERTVCP